MATDASRIVVAQLARVYLAPVGTAAPADPIIALADPWREVGLFTPDSLGWSTDPTFEEVRSHQSNYPTRRFQTEDAATVEVDLQEWSGENFKAVYGGGTITSVTGPPTHYKYVPPAIGGRSEVACIIEIADGSKHYRRIIPRCQQVEGAAQTFEKSSESTLPLRLSVMGADVGDAWYDLTDDPAFAPAGED
jgi:hypothetical protein